MEQQNQQQPKKPADRHREHIGGCQYGGWGEMGKGGQKVHTSSYKIIKSWDVMALTIVNNTMLRS